MNVARICGASACDRQPYLSFADRHFPYRHAAKKEERPGG
jgi:hypothetical protein